MFPRAILVADDDRLLRESLCDMLSDLGCAPVAVGNGGEAIEILKQHRMCDLVLSDVDMPDMTGFVLLSWLGQHRPTPSVLMSARADRDLDAAAHRAGALALLPKPVAVIHIKDLFQRFTFAGLDG